MDLRTPHSRTENTMQHGIQYGYGEAHGFYPDARRAPGREPREGSKGNAGEQMGEPSAETSSQTAETTPEASTGLIQEFRQRLVEICLIGCFCSMVVLSWSALSIAGDVRSLRKDAVTSLAATKAGLFARAEDAVGIMRDMLEVQRVLEDRLDKQLTQVRADVSRSSKDNQESTVQAAKATAAAVKESAARTDEVLDAVTDKNAHTIKVEIPRQPEPIPPPPVIVAPPTVLTDPTRLEKPPPEIPQKHGGISFKWLRKLWPFSKAKPKQ